MAAREDPGGGRICLYLYLCLQMMRFAEVELRREDGSAVILTMRLAEVEWSYEAKTGLRLFLYICVFTLFWMRAGWSE